MQTEHSHSLSSALTSTYLPNSLSLPLTIFHTLFLIFALPHLSPLPLSPSLSLHPLSLSLCLTLPLFLSPSLCLTFPVLLFVSLSLTRAGKCVSKQIGKGVFVAGAAAAVVGSAALVGVAVSNAVDNEEKKEQM